LREYAEVVDFVSELARRGVAVPAPEPALVNADGTRLEVPSPVFDALVHVAKAMAQGQGVTVMPLSALLSALLTTQEAADLLGISRPTLVRLLEDGEIAHEQRGRHRRRQGCTRQPPGQYPGQGDRPPLAAFPAFLDTCALYGAYLCDTLLCRAEAETYRPLWPAGVLDELVCPA
jgi:excisionase family DNA binding protein